MQKSWEGGYGGRAETLDNICGLAGIDKITELVLWSVEHDPIVRVRCAFKHSWALSLHVLLLRSFAVREFPIAAVEHMSRSLHVPH